MFVCIGFDDQCPLHRDAVRGPSNDSGGGAARISREHRPAGENDFSGVSFIYRARCGNLDSAPWKKRFAQRISAYPMRLFRKSLVPQWFQGQHVFFDKKYLDV